MFDLVIGAGQGGCRIAKEFSTIYQVEGRYLNLADVDFGRIEVERHHTCIVGEGEGTGRDPAVGETIARENYNTIKSFLKDAIKITEAEAVVVCVGGGGGSGTGMLFPVIEILQTASLEIFVIFTLPQKQEGLPAKPNALRALNRLIRDYIKVTPKEKQVVPMLIDNDFCYAKYGSKEGRGYWNRVNRGVAVALRRFYDLTDGEKMAKVDVASGYGALDYAEFYRILFFKEGFVDVREVLFEFDETKDTSLMRNKVKTASLIFGSLDIRTTKAYIVSIALPLSWKNTGVGEKFTSDLFDLLSRSTKTPYVLRSSYYSAKLQKARVNLLLSGMAKSHGLDKILRQTIKDTEKYKQKESVEELDLSDLDF